MWSHEVLAACFDLLQKDVVALEGIPAMLMRLNWVEIWTVLRWDGPLEGVLFHLIYLIDCFFI